MTIRADRHCEERSGEAIRKTYIHFQLFSYSTIHNWLLWILGYICGFRSPGACTGEGDSRSTAAA